MARPGQVEHFDESVCTWSSYEERVTAFLKANRVPDEDKVDALFSIIWPRTYTMLKSLTARALPSTKTFDTLKQLLRDHLDPKPTVLVKRVMFHRRYHLENETMPQFVAESRKLAPTSYEQRTHEVSDTEYA